MFKKLLLTAVLLSSVQAMADSDPRAEKAEMWTRHSLRSTEYLLESESKMTMTAICYTLGLQSQQLETATTTTMSYINDVLKEKKDTHKEVLTNLIKVSVLEYRGILRGYCETSRFNSEKAVAYGDKEQLIKALGELKVKLEFITVNLEKLAEIPAPSKK